eukprot:COSAG02_NODE_3409_length_6790_cov_149.811239_3_plen_87_part_00
MSLNFFGTDCAQVLNFLSCPNVRNPHGSVHSGEFGKLPGQIDFGEEMKPLKSTGGVSSATPTAAASGAHSALARHLSGRRHDGRLD